MSDGSPVDSFDQASLEAFCAELVTAGFEPVSGTARRAWIGPIHPALASLTTATTMRLSIEDGWPFVPPSLFADGLHSVHVNLYGQVCLWQPDDTSLEWITWDGLGARVTEWYERATGGWRPEDRALDAHLSFANRLTHSVAVLDLADVSGSAGSWGTFHASPHPSCLRLQPGGSSGLHLQGLWFSLGDLDTPPATLDEVLTVLNGPSEKALRRGLEARRAGQLPSGGVDLVVLSWPRHGQTDVLVLAFDGVGSETTAASMTAAPADAESLTRRAGPDAEALAERRVVIFGVGAVGSHVALLLAESGVGHLRLVDDQLLMPSNVVRHAVGAEAVGVPKVEATAALAHSHAPWSEVETVVTGPRSPTAIGAHLDATDLVIDATGNEAVSLAIASICEDRGVPLVVGALYRGGAVARIRRMNTPGDTPLPDRYNSKVYPRIPPGGEPSEFVGLEIGCDAPIHNAPPAAVASAAGLLAIVSIDALTRRLMYPDEVIEIHRPLAEAPFDRLGRL